MKAINLTESEKKKLTLKLIPATILACLGVLLIIAGFVFGVAFILRLSYELGPIHTIKLYYILFIAGVAAGACIFALAKDFGRATLKRELKVIKAENTFDEE